MEQAEISQTLADFITENYLFGEADRAPEVDDSLLDEGVIDSTGILELIEFLEARFGIVIGDSEAVPENLGSVGNLTRYVSSKMRAS